MKSAFIWCKPVIVKEMEDNLRGCKALMIWLSVGAVVWTIILIIIL